MANPFVQSESQPQDMERAKKLDTDMFDRKLPDLPGMVDTMIDVGEGTGGGMRLKPVPDMPDKWFPDIHGDDVAAATGAVFAPWQPNSDMEGGRKR